MTDMQGNKPLNRRKFLKVFGTGATALSVMSLAACNSTDVSDNSTSNTANVGNNSTAGSRDARFCVYSENNSSWATGGVKNLTAPFPSTSIFNNASTCALPMGEKTLGPCFFAVETGEDISFNKDGIPMQVCLQVVDNNCTPVANAQVEIWHCDRAGFYSADESGSSEAGRFSSNFCSGGNSEAESAKWFRGTLNTDGEGRVNFKSCFPGWYPGRTAHIHFRIKRNGQTSMISQFCFEDSLTTEIYTQHPAYSCRGNQDTRVTQDSIFGSMYQNYLMTTRKNSDNSMLAFKRIMLTS